MTIQALITADMPNPFGYVARTNATAITRSNTWARTGTYSFKLTGDENFSFGRGASSDTVYARFAIYAEQLPTASNYIFCYHLCESTTCHIALRFRDTGAIEIVRGQGISAPVGGTVLGTLTATLSVATAKLFEVYCVVNDSTGAVTVKVNGVTDTTLTSVDTRNGGSGVIDTINCSNMTGSGVSYWDDFAVGDNWCGSHGIHVLWPNGAGSNSGWTASTGNAYECVDADTDGAGDMTDYISDDTTSDKHDFAMSDLGFTPSAIGAVMVCATGTVPTGSGSARIYSISGGTTTNGDDTALSSTATNMSDLLGENDPDTATGWTASGINGLKVGVESRA